MTITSPGCRKWHVTSTKTKDRVHILYTHNVVSMNQTSLRLKDKAKTRHLEHKVSLRTNDTGGRLHHLFWIFTFLLLFLQILSGLGILKTIHFYEGHRFSSLSSGIVTTAIHWQQKLGSVNYPNTDFLQDDKLFSRLFAVWEVTCENTGFSPFELLLGCQPRGILSSYPDLITHNETTDNVKNSYLYVLELRE